MVKITECFLGIAMIAALGACGEQSEANDPQATQTTQARSATETATAAAQTANDPAPAAATTPTVAKAPSPEFTNLPAPYVDADYARAKRIWRQCSSCHTLAPDADHLVGPNLYGLFSRQVGASEGFNYSNALLEADFDWTPEKLDEWLTSPRKFLPGNRMSFSGVRKPADRVNVIAYIMATSATTAAE